MKQPKKLSKMKLKENYFKQARNESYKKRLIRLNRHRHDLLRDNFEISNMNIESLGKVVKITTENSELIDKIKILEVENKRIRTELKHLKEFYSAD